MSGILIVEDSRTQATAIRLRLEEAGYRTEHAMDGRQALEKIAPFAPDVVLTDLHMPNMDGLQLVEAVRREHPQIPVVLMTADGTEDIAVEALRKGASHYIPKRLFDRDLLPTLKEIIRTLSVHEQEQQAMEALCETRSTFQFGNDRLIAEAVISHLRGELERRRFVDRTGTFRVVLALKEALLNAIDHGNLEMDSKIRDDEEHGAWFELCEQRQTTQPYSSRRVTVVSRIEPDKLTVIVRDEGPGFDPSTIPDPRNGDNVLRAHGRGLMLIQNFMDDVRFNDAGNEITMIKYHESNEERLTNTASPAP